MIHIITNGDKVRKKIVKKSVEGYGYKCKFHAFEKHLTDKNLGRFMSHFALYKYAAEHDMEYIWIAEDTIVQGYDEMSSSLKTSIDTFTSGPDWDILYLGAPLPLFCSYKNTSIPHIFQSNVEHGSHCYIIHRRCYQALLKSVPKPQLSIAQYMMENTEHRSFIAYPLPFYKQSHGSSGLGQAWNSITRHPSFIKAHEWLVRHGWMSVPVCLGILLAMVMILYWLFKH